MSESDTTTISTSPLMPTPPLLILAPVSSPFLPSSTSSDTHRGSFHVAVFLSRKGGKCKQAAHLRSLLQRVCNEANRVSEFPHPRGNRAITPSDRHRHTHSQDRTEAPAWKPQLVGPKPPEVRRQLLNSGGPPLCFWYHQCGHPTTHMITLLTV